MGQVNINHGRIEVITSHDEEEYSKNNNYHHNNLNNNINNKVNNQYINLQNNQINPINNQVNINSSLVDHRSNNNNFNMDMNMQKLNERVKSSIDRHDYDILLNDKDIKKQQQLAYRNYLDNQMKEQKDR